MYTGNRKNIYLNLHMKKPEHYIANGKLLFDDIQKSQSNEKSRK